MAHHINIQDDNKHLLQGTLHTFNQKLFLLKTKSNYLDHKGPHLHVHLLCCVVPEWKSRGVWRGRRTGRTADEIPSSEGDQQCSDHQWVQYAVHFLAQHDFSKSIWQLIDFAGSMGVAPQCLFSTDMFTLEVARQPYIVLYQGALCQEKECHSPHDKPMRHTITLKLRFDDAVFKISPSSLREKKKSLAPCRSFPSVLKT